MFGPLREVPRDILNLAGGVIAFALVALLAFVTWAFVFRPMPDSNREPMMILLGILSANIGQIIGFFFGTSYGSQKKTEAIDRLTKP